jgi:hypothetical protein
LDDYDDDPDEYLTALNAASYSKDFQILKRLKPDAKRDDVDMLLTNAARCATPMSCLYLLRNRMTNSTVVRRLSLTVSRVSDTDLST